MFDNEKDLIFRITNLVLIIWLVGSITAFWIKVVDVIYPEEIPVYEQYKYINCQKYIEIETTEDTPKYSEEDCKNQYDNQYLYLDERVYENKKQIFILLGNIIIVGVVLFILNRKKVNK